MKPIVIAVAGAGYWGNNLIRNLASMPGASLAYVCDLDAACLDAVAQKYPAVCVTKSLEDVLGDATVQAVVVATPAEAHKDVSLACLEAGKHVFVEKPLATCKEDAEEIVRVAGAKDLILMVGHIFLYDPAVCKFIELVHTGKIGQIRYITSVRTSMAGTARLDTNVVWDALIHDSYILAALCGCPPKRVLVNGRGYLSDLEDVAFATFDFGNKVLAQCYASWYALEKARRITVIGSNGILHLDDFAKPRLAYHHRRYVRGSSLDAKGRPRWQWMDDGMETPELEAGQPLWLECEHFLECIRTKSQPRTPGKSALLAVEILEACQASLAADGAWMPVRSDHV